MFNISSSFKFLTTGFIKSVQVPVRVPLLHVVELPHDIARGAARDAGNRSQSIQIRAMADLTGTGPLATIGDQLFTFFNTPDRHVREEAGMGIPK